jgi:hypothetical protein
MRHLRHRTVAASAAVGHVHPGVGQRAGERAESLLDIGQGGPAVGVALSELGVGARGQLTRNPGRGGAQCRGERGVMLVQLPG